MLEKKNVFHFIKHEKQIRKCYFEIAAELSLTLVMQCAECQQ